MSRVKIIGGGLTGILAAFQAHRMGVRHIELHERFDKLGGVALSDDNHGVELRHGCIYFGPKGDPIREILEAYGATFEEIDNCFGSVSPGVGGKPFYVEDFGGPALPSAGIQLGAPSGVSLADRLAAYPAELKKPLTRYAKWHLGCDLKDVHHSAAIPMAINRVYPVGANLAALADAKRHDPIADDLYAIPRALWGRTDNVTASLPAGGFPTFLRRCRLSLEAIGVTIHDASLVSPREAIATHKSDEVLVWAANPTPLFKAVGIATPRLIPKSFATYVFDCGWTGARPFYVQNFTAEGSCFRIYIYESAGRTLLTAECVAEATNADLRYDIHRLLRGFDGDLALGEQLHAAVRPRWIYHSVDAIDRLADLRTALGQQMGPAFVPGAWEPYAKAEKFAAVGADLAQALGGTRRSAAAA